MAVSWEVPNRNLQRLKAIPKLGSMYASLNRIRSAVDLADAPPMTEADYLIAMAEPKRWDCSKGAFAFMSSGTTGAPKIGLHPSHQHIPDILAQWRPNLGERGRVFVDFSAGGRACSTNQFFREVALFEGMTYFHCGNVDVADLDAAWHDILTTLNPAAVSGSPSLLEIIASYLVSRGETLPEVEAILWTGEPLKQYHADALKSAFPGARLWSVYGGTEPWVVGYQTPEMPINEFKILDYQFAEVLNGTLHVTSLNPDVINPILRFRMPDAVDVLDRDESIRRIRVRERQDRTIYFDGYKVNPYRAANALRKVDGVDDVQLVFWQQGGVLRSVEVRLRLEHGKKSICIEDVIGANLAGDLQHDVLRDLLVMRAAEPFVVDQRSGKSPPYVIKELEKSNVVNLNSAA